MIKAKLRNLYRNKKLSDLSVYGFGQAFNLVTPILVVPYIISICGIENYGKIGVALSLAFFLIVFIDYGSEIISVREISLQRDNKVTVSEIFSTTQLAKTIMLFIIIGFCSLLFFAIPYFRNEFLLYIFTLSILIGQVVNPVWFLQGVENYKLITIVNVISKLLYLTFVFLFIREESDYIFVNLYWGLGAIIANVGMLIYLNSHYKFKLLTKNFISARKYIVHNFALFTSQLFTSLQMYLPIMLIGWLGSNVMAGQYKVIEQIVGIFRTYILLSFNFLYPKICYGMQESYKRTVKYWAVSNGINSLFVFVCLVVIGIYRVPIINYFTKADMLKLTALLLLALLIPAIQAVQIPLKQLLLAMNRNKVYVRISFVQTLLILLLVVVSLVYYELFAVIWAIIISELIISFAYLYFVLLYKEKS
ncbi:MAG: oligosaccharide flippase family protein [Flavobacterium sp.]